ncbi:TetR/AcrR family transcriptional regulator [Amycolatopsis sp. NPDC049253]|uniref:TetR/AcrR family transcriptional regulator n=1 Tax=Amycolatopsis sp. NPDC049253 TaxID=3155274 RepID=UPI003417E896
MCSVTARSSRSCRCAGITGHSAASPRCSTCPRAAPRERAAGRCPPQLRAGARRGRCGVRRTRPWWHGAAGRRSAGVGKATIYRSFPTKDDLVETIARQYFEDLEDRTVSALAEPKPDRAFHDYVVDLFGLLSDNRLMAEVLADGVGASSTRILDLLADLLAAACSVGYLRSDATVTDLRVLLCGAVLQLMRLNVGGEATWRRYGELVINALRPAEHGAGTDA